MRGIAALALVFALAACNEAQTPSQSTATPSAPAQSAPGAAGPGDKEPKAPPSLPGQLAAAGETSESETIDVNTREGRAQLEGLMRAMMDEAAPQLAAGYRADAGLPDQYPLLRLRESPHNWQVSLVAGADYRFVGGCDMDCNNVDLELLDAAGTVVASDTLPDDFPVVTFTPPAAGVYTVRTHLRTCEVEPCMVAVRALTR